MEIVLSSKYQLLVPKEVRNMLNLKGGQKFQIITKEGIIMFIPDIPLKELQRECKGLNTKDIRENEDRL